MKLLHRLNVMLAGLIEFRNPVEPFYTDARDYVWRNRGRNVAHRMTFHFFEWRASWTRGTIHTD